MSRVLAQAMSRNVGWHDSLRLQHAPGCHRDRQNRRLSDFRQLQLIFRTFKTQLRKLVTERGVGFVKGLARHRIQGGKFLAHAHGLRTLSGKKKCERRRV